MRRQLSSSSRVEATQTTSSIRLTASGHLPRLKMPYSSPLAKSTAPRSPDSSYSKYSSLSSDSRASAQTRSHHQPSTSADHRRTTSIPRLREALNSLESQMASLMTERLILESRLEQAVRLQSPVQRLPSELLGSIFAIGVLELEEEDSVLLSTLMLVCKYWTDVALATPILWSRITVGNHDSLVKARRKLARSKSVPLDICIQFNPRLEHASAVTELVIHAMDILRPSIWRWRSFRLAVPNRPQAHAALVQCTEYAPLLEEFSVQIHHFMQEDHYSTPPLPLFHGHTPRLRSCSFTSFNFGWDPSLVSNLRVLKLGGFWNGFSPSAATIVSILRACPALEELALRNLSDIDPDSCPGSTSLDMMGHPSPSLGNYVPRSGTMVNLPRLRRASFYYAGVVRVQSIFSQLSFPALERIEFSYLDNITLILKHLKRQSFSSLPLRHLRIESSFFNELKLVRLLQRLPSLHTLELVDAEDISSNFLKGLSSPPVTQAWICPKLEMLNLDGCTTIDWDALRTLVESRLPSNAPRMLNPVSASSFPHDNAMIASSASMYAQRRREASLVPTAIGIMPKRLRTVDLTRCHQISKEMLQWLRMYVAEVRCESAKTFWGEGGFL